MRRRLDEQANARRARWKRMRIWHGRLCGKVLKVAHNNQKHSFARRKHLSRVVERTFEICSRWKTLRPCSSRQRIPAAVIPDLKFLDLFYRFHAFFLEIKVFIGKLEIVPHIIRAITLLVNADNGKKISASNDP